MLNNTKSTEHGFTIVELLIVIVVIAILAAITIVAYNGIQTRARNSAASSAAENMAKKLEAYNATTGSYPKYDSAANVTTALNGQNESALTGSGLTIGSPSSTNGGGTVQVKLCTTTAPTAGTTVAVGYQIFRFDYGTNLLQTSPDQSGGTTTGVSPFVCTTLS